MPQKSDKPDNQITVDVTAYRPIRSQTDGSPNHTSIGTPALMGICAVSQDLIRSGTVNYGDMLFVPGIGLYLVMDTMNPRHKEHVDILVYTKTQEKLVGWRKCQVVTILRIK
jgi:3D (Asp-Asp-Asp) domain-containing protein